MDERVHEVRSKNWAEIIAACNTSGQTKAEWCRENGVTLRQFYYWQKKLRGELYEAARGRECTGLASYTGNSPKVIFAEIPSAPMAADKNTFCADAVIRVGAVTMEISNTASKQLVESLGRVISNAIQRNGV